MRGFMRKLLVRSVALSVFLAASIAAHAGMDVDFGASAALGSDTDLFFRISSRYFDRDRPAIDTWGRHFTDSDDVAVFFFLARHSGKSPDAIHALRRSGISWFEVGLRVGVPVDAWFVPVESDPGPPFGKAYGRYKKHKKQHTKKFSLSDAECRNLVSVRILHEYYSIPAQAAFELRASGRDVRTLLCNEYEERHRQNYSASKAKAKRVSNDDHSKADAKSSRHHH